jgi:hypothetical protein
MAETFLSLLNAANNSGVDGLARVTLDSTALHVDTVATGLTPGQMHPFHIHGFSDGSGTERPAIVSDDTNGNGLVETPEGAAASGPPLFDLTASGANTHGAGTGTDFPTADANGHLQLSQAYQLDPAQPNDAQILAQLDGRILELHGLNLSNGASGATTATTSYNADLPASQGQLFAASSTTGQADGTGGTPGTDGSSTGFDWLHADSASFLQHADAVLAALAPYELKPDGSGPVTPEPPGAAQTEATDFAALILPENNSGAFGAATVHFDSDASTISVDLWTTGLTPDETHAAHLHGFSNLQPSLLANLSLDVDRDNFVEDQEGEKVTGPVIMALTQDGSISDAELTANFASADANGNLQLHQTYQFDTSDPVQKEIFSELEDRLVGREIQLHGLDVTAQQGAGTVNEVNGEEGYKPNLPAAAGILLPITDGSAGQDIASLAHALEMQFANHPAPSDSVIA